MRRYGLSDSQWKRIAHASQAMRAGRLVIMVDDDSK
ncbi:hypothetical protein CD178_03243 (plasmid) [Komagataeibacter saccharivorans]|uniref:Uncharacterized protein n=1 Tax=Komagataeibacter saccharivorans TaxID=265959 RepID=A0A347WGJ4_9PROT|nr:hypothetical protein S101446_03228 [Komagataeibacter europaeus]AXY23987.1 hypothetical protein CD178_03243 [Komagataeibacter saccharivorans]